MIVRKNCSRLCGSDRERVERPSGLVIISLFMPIVKCPHCGQEKEFNGNEFRPFCSERCKLLDFGEWADGNYSLPAETAEMTEEELLEIEKAREDQAK